MEWTTNKDLDKTMQIRYLLGVFTALGHLHVMADATMDLDRSGRSGSMSLYVTSVTYHDQSPLIMAHTVLCMQVCMEAMDIQISWSTLNLSCIS